MAVVINSEMPANALVSSGASVSLTFSFTNTSGTFLAVHAQPNTTTGVGSISSVTYAGSACTPRVSATWDTNATPNCRISWYTLASPATGANNVVITNSLTMMDIIGGAISTTGESGSIGVTNTGFNDSGSTSHSLSLAGTTAGSLCLFSAGCGSSISTRSLTLSAALNASNATGGDNGTLDRSAGTGGTVTDNWTAAVSDLWGSAALEILPSGGGGGGGAAQMLLLLGAGGMVRLAAVAKMREPLTRRTLAKVVSALLMRLPK